MANQWVVIVAPERFDQGGRQFSVMRRPARERRCGNAALRRISSNDHLVVDGQIEGSVTVKNTVTIGKSGRVRADITATTLNVHGKIIGDVVATDRVAIEPSGSIEGNINSPKLMINEG